MVSLVGNTGFVGSNIASECHFDGLYHSTNISEAYGTKPNLLIYCGVRAAKYAANLEPEQDLAHIGQAIVNIERIQPEKVVLISTADVYPAPVNVDESSDINRDLLGAYGRNRLFLENWVGENVKSHLIVRLPALYGRNLKKNFLYDMMNPAPSFLNPSVFAQLSEKDSFIGSFYEKQASGFYRLKALPAQGRERLTAHLRAAGFDAINYTDSRSNYQFYNLRSLVGHIKTALQNGIAKLNITTEPINAAELYEYIRCRPFQNNIPGAIADYDCKTIYSDIFNGRNGYIFDKSFVLEDVKRFVQGGDP